MWSNKYIKTPFKEHGRELDGADCWGLIVLMFQHERKISLPCLNDYPDTKDKVTIPKIIENECSRWQRVEIGEEQAFDVAVFRIRGEAMHVGLVVSKGVMIHCEYGSGTTHTHYNKEQQWSRRLIGFFRYAQCSDSPPTV